MPLGEAAARGEARGRAPSRNGIAADVRRADGRRSEAVEHDSSASGEMHGREEWWSVPAWHPYPRRHGFGRNIGRTVRDLRAKSSRHPATVRSRRTLATDGDPGVFVQVT